MLKETITYTNFDGVEVKEDFYFNLTKAEIAQMQLEEKGGLAAKLQSIVDEKDPSKIIVVFKDLILKAYGEKSPDGKYFLKSEEIRRKFEATQAYSDFYMKLISDPDKAAAFIKAIVPQDLSTEKPAEKLAEIAAKKN